MRFYLRGHRCETPFVRLGAAACLLLILVFSGCNTLPAALSCLLGWPCDCPVAPITGTAKLTADTTATNPTTGLPATLEGTITGEFAGTYRETLIEVYFDGNGAPIAAISRSDISLTSPQVGTLTSFNDVTVTEMIVQTDDNGNPVLNDQGKPVVIGLRSAATGQIIRGTGDFEGMTGQLHSDSVLMLTGGQSGLGTVSSDLSFVLNAGVSELSSPVQ